jgi:hypothetical protein
MTFGNCVNFLLKVMVMMTVVIMVIISAFIIKKTGVVDLTVLHR